MGTFLVGAVVAIMIGLIIRSMVKDKKAGKSLQCGKSCAQCHGNCEVEASVK